MVMELWSSEVSGIWQIYDALVNMTIDSRTAVQQRRSQVSLVGGLTEFQGGNKPQYLYL